MIKSFNELTLSELLENADKLLTNYDSYRLKDLLISLERLYTDNTFLVSSELINHILYQIHMSGYDTIDKDKIRIRICYQNSKYIYVIISIEKIDTIIMYDIEKKHYKGQYARQVNITYYENDFTLLELLERQFIL